MGNTDSTRNRTKMMRFVAIVALLLASVSAAFAQYPAEVRITADNIYWLWLNPGVLAGDGTADSSFLGTNSAGGAGVDNWGTPESYFVQLKPGVNTIVVKAMNVVGQIPYG